MLAAKIRRQTANRFPQDAKMVQDRGLDELVGFERCFVSWCALLDPLNRFENVKQSVTIASHSRTAC